MVTTGFLRSDRLMIGCSLDAHVGDFDGIIEAKCPLPATHLSYLRSGVVPLNYLQQITHNMWIANADWADFVSFNPDFPEQLQLKVVRIARNSLNMPEYIEKAVTFLQEVDDEYAAVQELMGPSVVWKGAKAA